MPILNIPVKEWGADLAEQAKRKAQAAMQQVQDAGGDAIAESQRQAKEARDEWMKTQIDAAMNPIREAGHAAAEGLSALGDRAQEAGQTAQQNLQQNASAVAEAPVGQAIGEKASGLGTFAQGVRQDLRKGADAAVAADTAMDTALSERDAADRASAPTIPEEVSAPPSFQVPGALPAMTADTLPNPVEFPTNVAKNYLGSMGKSAEDLTDPEEWKKTAAAAQEIAPEVLNPVQTGARLVSDKAARDTFVEKDLPAAGQVLKTVGDIGNVVPNPEEQLENVAASAALEATKNTGMPEPVKAGIAMAAGSGIPTNLLKRAFKVPGGLSSQLDEAGRAAMGNGKLAAVDGAGDIGDIPEPTKMPDMHRPQESLPPSPDAERARIPGFDREAFPAPGGGPALRPGEASLPEGSRFETAPDLGPSGVGEGPFPSPHNVENPIDFPRERTAPFGGIDQQANQIPLDEALPPARSQRAQQALEEGAGSEFYRRVEAGEFDHLDDKAFNKELISDLTEPGESADQGLFSGTRPMEGPFPDITQRPPGMGGDEYGRSLEAPPLDELGPERSNFRVPGSGMSVADQIAGRTLGAVQGGIAGDRQDEDDTGWERLGRIGSMAALGAAAPPQNVKAASLARGLLRNADNIGRQADELGVRAGAVEYPGRTLTDPSLGEHPGESTPAFYSKLERSLDKLPRQGTSQQMKKTILAQGVRPDELKWTGIEDYLDLMDEVDPDTGRPRVVSLDELRQNVREGRVNLRESVRERPVITPEMTAEAARLKAAADAADEANTMAYRATSVAWDNARARLSLEGRTRPRRARVAEDPEVVEAIEAHSRALEAREAADRAYKQHMEALGGSEGTRAKYEEYSQGLKAGPGNEQAFDEWEPDPNQPGFNGTEKGDVVARPGYREIVLNVDTSRGKDIPSPYKNPHFGPAENTPLHMRVTDRTLPDGRKILHIEEMQSDWHQAALTPLRDAQGKPLLDENGKVIRRGYQKNVEEQWANQARLEREADDLVSREGLGSLQGWAGDDPRRRSIRWVMEGNAVRGRMSAIGREMDAIDPGSSYGRGVDAIDPDYVEDPALTDLSAQMQALQRHLDDIGEFRRQADRAAMNLESNEGRPPHGPWEKSWNELGMKRALRMAAEEGYDGVSWTPALVHQQRYGQMIPERFEKLEYNPDTHFLVAYDKEGGIRELGDVTPEKLPDYIGPDLAQRMLGDEPMTNIRVVDGQPTRERYHILRGDDLVVTNPGSKGFETQYEKVMPQTADALAKPWGQKSYQGEIELTPGGDRTPAHILEITPEMRKGVTEQGFPLFIRDQQGGTSEMGLADQIAGRAAGAIQGGVAADRSDEDDTGWERAGRIATGAALGAAAKPANVNLASLARGAIRNADKLGSLLGDEAGELGVTPGDKRGPGRPRIRTQADLDALPAARPPEDMGTDLRASPDDYPEDMVAEEFRQVAKAAAERANEIVRIAREYPPGPARAALEKAARNLQGDTLGPLRGRMSAQENRRERLMDILAKQEQVDAGAKLPLDPVDMKAETDVAPNTGEPYVPAPPKPPGEAGETPPAKPVEGEGESSQVDTGKSPDDPLGQKPESERKAREYTPEQQAEREAERARRAAALAAEREAKDAERAEARGRREAAQQAEREARARQKEAAAAVKKAERDMEKAVSADEKRMARETLAEAKRMEREAERDAEEARRTWAASDKTEATTGQMPMDMEGNEGKGAQMGLPTESGVKPLTPEQQRVADALATPADANAPIAPGRHKLNDHDARARENLIRGHIREGQSLAQATKKVDDHFDTVLDARKDMKAPGIGDWVETVRYSGGLLSNPATAAGDFAAGLAETPWVYARNRLLDLGDPKAEWVRKAEQAGYGKGFKNGIGNFGEILKSGRELKELVPGAAAEDVPESVARRYAARGEYGRAKLAGAAEMPMRVRNGLDAVNHGSLYSGLIYREAAKAVNKTDLTPGSPEWTTAVQEFVNKTADQDLAEDSAEFLARKRALREADRSLGRNDPGKIGTFLSGAFKQPPLRPFFPLFKTGYNIAMRGLERSPVGAGGIFVDKLLGREVTPERIMDSAMGSTLSMALTAYAVKSGNISGYGPEDKGTRDDLMAQGWKPWSVRLPDGRWYSYTRFGAAAAPLAMAGAVGDASQYHAPDEPPGERMKTAGGNFGRWFGNQFLLRSVGNIQDVTTNPKAKAASYFGRMASQYTGTASLLGTPASMLDPYERDTEKGGVNPFVNEMLKNIPIARQSLEPKYDVFGEEVPNPASGWGTLNPYTPGPDPKAVDDRFRNLRKYTGSESAAEDRRIAQALAAWKAEAGGAGPPLGDEASDLANRFLGGNDIDYLFAKGEAKEAEAMRENERALARLGG